METEHQEEPANRGLLHQNGVCVVDVNMLCTFIYLFICSFCHKDRLYKYVHMETERIKTKKTYHTV